MSQQNECGVNYVADPNYTSCDALGNGWLAYRQSCRQTQCPLGYTTTKEYVQENITLHPAPATREDAAREIWSIANQRAGDLEAADRAQCTALRNLRKNRNP